MVRNGGGNVLPTALPVLSRQISNSGHSPSPDSPFAIGHQRPHIVVRQSFCLPEGSPIRSVVSGYPASPSRKPYGFVLCLDNIPHNFRPQTIGDTESPYVWRFCRTHYRLHCMQHQQSAKQVNQTPKSDKDSGACPACKPGFRMDLFGAEC